MGATVGVGAALRAGFWWAKDRGFDVVVVIGSDLASTTTTTT